MYRQSVLFGTAAILGVVVESELMRWSVDRGGPAADRCLVWLVDGAAESQTGVDLMCLPRHGRVSGGPGLRQTVTPAQFLAADRVPCCVVCICDSKLLP